MSFPTDLPDVADVGETGHTTDHNTIRSALLDVYSLLTGLRDDVDDIGDVVAAGGAIGVDVHGSSTQIIATATFTAVTLGSPSHDDAGFYSVGSTTLYTVPAGGAGWYSINGMIDFGAASGGAFRYLGLYVNGAEFRYIDAIPTGSADSSTPQGIVSALAYLADGDTVEMQVYHNRGSSLTLAYRALSLVRL